jgi:hypothetical protein
MRKLRCKAGQLLAGLTIFAKQALRHESFYLAAIGRAPLPWGERRRFKVEFESLGNRNRDKIDRRLLGELQSQGRVTCGDLTQGVGLAAPRCLRRVHGLEGPG